MISDNYKWLICPSIFYWSTSQTVISSLASFSFLFCHLIWICITKATLGYTTRTLVSRLGHLVLFFQVGYLSHKHMCFQYSYYHMRLSTPVSTTFSPIFSSFGSIDMRVYVCSHLLWNLACSAPVPSPRPSYSIILNLMVTCFGLIMLTVLFVEVAHPELGIAWNAGVHAFICMPHRPVVLRMHTCVCLCLFEFFSEPGHTNQLSFICHSTKLHRPFFFASRF